tara:strand:- start:45 stop:428 length:384 start_codon:yes stop_codon:yes gene_type:complete
MEVDILRVKAICEEYCELVKCDTRKKQINVRLSDEYFRELYTRLDILGFQCKSIQKVVRKKNTLIIATFILNMISEQELKDFFKNMDSESKNEFDSLSFLENMFNEDKKDLELYDEDDEADWWKKSK